MQHVGKKVEEWRLWIGLKADPLLAFIPVLLALGALVALAWRFVLAVGTAGLSFVVQVQGAVLAGFAVHRLLVVVLAPKPWAQVRAEPVGALLAVALVSSFLVFRAGFDVSSIAVQWIEATGVALVLVYIVLTTAYRLGVAGMHRFHIRATTAVILSFAVLIALGTGLLLSPRATPPGQEIGVVDAFFTATSASCVTGLVVRDTGTGFTLFGQMTILVLIQVGGLGIMTLAAFFAAAVGRGLSIRDQVVMRQALQMADLGRLRQILFYILVSTLAVEAAGALLIYRFDGTPAPGGALERAYRAVFHSVAAFCNAGFGLYPDSLMSFRSNPGVLITVAALVLVGGLGFIVTYDIFNIVTRGFLARFLPQVWRRRRGPAGRPRLVLQSRLVLLVSGLLLAAGTGLLLLFEWNAPALEGHTAGEKVLASFFQSAMARTAGFNSVNVGLLTTASLFLLVNLMFVGGSPGSTAGGIKTTTVAILSLRVFGLMSHREEIEVFGRLIPRRLIAEAIAVIFLSFLAVSLCTLVLSHTDPRFKLEQTLFEVVSAFGTVGFSTGITPELSVYGKLLIAGLMFAGRVGPLTLVLFMGETRVSRPIYQYPTGNVMIG